MLMIGTGHFNASTGKGEFSNDGPGHKTKRCTLWAISGRNMLDKRNKNKYSIHAWVGFSPQRKKGKGGKGGD